MKIHNLQQGSKQWLEHRRTTYNASDAPAMLGASPYKSRDELIRELATGIVNDVDPGTQRRFDKGHQFEALARPIAEKIIGEELYPVCGSEEFGLAKPLAASYDGLTMLEDIAFEHKTLNAELREIMTRDGFTPKDLPEHYRIQMDQQILVSKGAIKKVLFMASKWSENGELIEEKHCWYTGDPVIANRIIDGWAQLEKDVTNYKPEQATPEIVAEAMLDLPAVSVQVSGSIAIQTNLQLFGSRLTEFVRDLNTKPETDQDFANAEAAVKVLQKAESALTQAENNALAQVSDVDDLRKTISAYRETARKTRLMLEKLVKEEKANRKAKLISDARELFQKHVIELESSIKPIRLNITEPDFADAVHGLKSLSSMKEKLNSTLANGKLDADSIVRELREKLDWFNEHASAHKILFADLQQIIVKEMDDFQLVIKTRINEHKRLEAEKEAKIKAEAEEAARQKIAAEEAEKASQPASIASIPEIDKTINVIDKALGADNGQRIKLGDINAALGFKVSADFLASIGWPAVAKDKSALLYREIDFPAICGSIVEHIAEVSSKHQFKKAA